MRQTCTRMHTTSQNVDDATGWLVSRVCFFSSRFAFPFPSACSAALALHTGQYSLPVTYISPPPPNTTRRCHGPIMSCHSILSGGQWNIGAHIDATLHTNLPDLCVSFPGREACRRRQRAMRRTRLKRPRPFSGFNGREPFAGSSPRLSTDQRNNSWHATEYQGGRWRFLRA